MKCAEGVTSLQLVPGCFIRKHHRVWLNRSGFHMQIEWLSYSRRRWRSL